MTDTIDKAKMSAQDTVSYIESLNEELEEKDAAISNLEAQVDSLNGEITTLKDKVWELEQDLKSK